MEIKKYPKKQLENFSKIFMQIGLTLALFITYTLLEHKTFEKNNLGNLGVVTMIDDMKEDIPIIEIQELKPPPKNTPPPIVEKIKIVEDDLKIEDTITESTETDETEGVIINTEEIIEVEEAEEVIEDIPFILIEDVPVYPGCLGNNDALKACFTKKISLFFQKNFDTNIAKDSGLTEGKKRLFVVFKIDHTGNVVDAMAKKPHPKLEKEVLEIIQSLPKMIPGKQRGKPVGVKYSLPITFYVK